MSAAAMPEPRSAVMILVDATWEDQQGVLQTARACIENRSATGACIRLRNPVHVGAKLRVEWRWEEFCGVAKYCRVSGPDYLVGIHLEAVQLECARNAKTKQSCPVAPLARTAAPPEKAKGGFHIGVGKSQPASKSLDAPIPQSQATARLSTDQSLAEEMNIPTASMIPEATAASPRSVLIDLKTQQNEREAKQPRITDKGERTFMGRKWMELTKWGNKQHPGAALGNANGADNSPVVSPGEKTRRDIDRTPSERPVPKPAAHDSGFQAELLCMEDIYRAAGIMEPHRGYSIGKVVEMLHSDHMRGLSKEMKRAAVLMALDAAGVSADEVMRDAKLRQEAIDSYEAEQRKQVEAEWSRKAEENLELQAELERIKLHYLERVKRNLDGVAREKTTFGNWLTAKQQESQSMSEAVDLCLKPLPAEPPRDSLAGVALADASTKPV